VSLVHNSYRDCWPPDERERFAIVERRACEVFGNSLDADIWLSGFDPQIGEGCRIDQAARTPDGAARAVAVLDELARIVTPRVRDWPPKLRHRRRR
jgi:uncharacterized protein (DUF2384 family)